MDKNNNLENISSQALLTVVKQNNELIRTYYRFGWFEQKIRVVVYSPNGESNFTNWLKAHKKKPKNEKELNLILFFEDSKNMDFYHKVEDENKSEWRSISLEEVIKSQSEPNSAEPIYLDFKNAVEILYDQVQPLISDSRFEVRKEVLKAKIVIYECLDYYLTAPQKITNDFINYARELNKLIQTECSTSFQNIKQFAKQTLNLPENASNKEIKESLKLIIIGSLGGVAAFYHQHNSKSYAEGLKCVESILEVVNIHLPNFEETNRESRGLLGLTYYLKGQLERASGGKNLGKAELSLISSLEVYSERVVEKEFFMGEGWIEEKVYQEKLSVSLRRASLVSALGLGYFYFTSGKLAQAEMALTLSRAVLRQNSGQLYGTYADMIYWGVQRAKYSDNPNKIRKVCDELIKCENDFKSLENKVKGFKTDELFYLQRCYLELSLAYRYASDFELDKKNYLKKAEAYATKVVEFASGGNSKGKEHPNLLSEALFIRSHIHRKNDNLNASFQDAENAIIAVGYHPNNSISENILIVPDVLIAYAAILTRLAKDAKDKGDQKSFARDFQKAEHHLLEALKIGSFNRRFRAICYLRLAKLFLLDKNSYSRAHYYFFDKWNGIKKNVEHRFCHSVAKDLTEQFNALEKEVFVIDFQDDLKFEDAKKNLLNFLIDKAIRKTRDKILNSGVDQEGMKSMLVKELIAIGLKKSDAYNKIKDKEFNLMEKLERELQSHQLKEKLR